MRGCLLAAVLLLGVANAAETPKFDALKRAASNPKGSVLSCSSMSYGVSCRGTLTAYSTDPVSIQWANKAKYIITLSEPKFTLNQVAPKRTASARQGYEKITSGPFVGHFIRQMGKMLVIRSAQALNGVY